MDPIARVASLIVAPSRAWRTLDSRWAGLLAAVAIVVQVTTLPRVLPPVTETTRPWLLDSIIFEYVGWSLTTGSRLYVDLWAIKPPLAFEVPALLAVLAGDDVLLYHWLAVGLTNLAAIASVLLVGAVVHELTDDGLAALAAGLSLYALPAFHWRAAIGFKTKYFVLALAMLGIYLALRERPALAGVAAAGSVGFWQIAVVVPGVVLGLAALNGRRDLTRAVGGFALGSAIVLAPVVYPWRAFVPMVTEAVLHPLLAPEGGSIPGRLRVSLFLLGPAVPAVFVGVYGLASGAREDHRTTAIAAGALWFVAAAVLFDLDTFPDLFVAFGFLAVGIGLAAERGRLFGRLVLVAVVVMATVNVATLGGVFVRLDGFHLNEPYRLADSPGVDRIERPIRDRQLRQAVFWHRVPSDTCRPFAARTQYRVSRVTNQPFDAERCGRFGPAWRAILAEYG